MLYKDGIWRDSETDTDADDLPYCCELVLFANLFSFRTAVDMLNSDFLNFKSYTKYELSFKGNIF